MKNTGYIIILFLLLSFQASATNNSKLNKTDITNLNINSGLASNEVTCMIEDDMKFMWFGTTNGLCRYDGYQFKTYRSDYLSPSLFLSNHILLMEKDAKDNLWIVTTKEITIFNPKTGYTTPVVSDTHLLNKINSLLITQNGKVILGTTNGIYQWDVAGSKFTLLKKAHVRSLFEDSRGIIWVGTWGNGFFTFNLETSETKSFITTYLGKPLNVTSFVEDKKHNIWVSTWDNGGLIKVEEAFKNGESKYKLYPSLEKPGCLASSVLYKLVYDKSSDHIWVGTAKGLSVLNELDKTNGFITYGAEQLGSSEIWTMYSSSKNVLWVSALGGGINKMVNRNLSFVYNSLPKKRSGSAIVTALYEDQNNVVWMGTRLDVLLFWDRNSDKQYSYKEIDLLKDISKESNAVQAILKDRTNENIWLGTRYEGIYILTTEKGKLKKLYKLTDQYPNIKTINYFAQDSSGKIWIGTDQGLFVVQSVRNNIYDIRPIEQLNRIICNGAVQTLLSDNKGIWIGTKDYGAFYLDKNGKLSRYDVINKKLNYDNVLCLKKDSKGQIWVGTQGGGLSKYNRSKDCFEMLESVQMFSDNAIYSIVEDKQNHLWLTTGKGIVRMNLNRKDDVVLYTQSDGIVNSQFAIGSSLLLSNGEILFGGYNGIDCYKYLRKEGSQNPPQTAIVDISIMNMSLHELMDKSEIEENKLPPYTQKLVLAYDRNNVMFNFSCLSYTNPQANRYAYKMKGVDKDWIYVDSNKRYISYNNLVEGKYVFQVKSCNENSIWSSPVEVEITILPAPWLTWWAYTIYALLLCIGTYMVVRTVKRRILLKNALKIEQIERKKSEEVNQAKLNFFTNISHELFTPLSVMQCSIESLNQDGQADRQTLNIMRINLKRLQRLLQQILEFRKAESGNLKLKVSHNNVVTFIKGLCEENFLPLLQSKNITLKFQAEQDTIMAYFDIDKLDKIIYNLLSNATKYNYPNGIVSVSITQNTENEIRYFTLKVENTGDGIPENKLPMLFKRFYEGDYRKFKTQGTGIGLSLTRDLVRLHNGTISVQSVPNETTLFTVQIPADRTNYTEDQIDEECLLRSDSINDSAESTCEDEHEQVHVLIVEDDKDLMTIMTKVLGKYFQISSAANGLEALTLLKTEQIDIVITDYEMPQMNGIELCREIRKDIALNHLPIIMLTVKAQTEFFLEAYDAGADVYITKPVEMILLTAQLRTLITNRNLLIQKFRQKEDLNVQELGLTQLDQKFLDNAISIVEQKMEDSEFSNETFCQMINMTQSTLYRKLKSITGLSPNEFIRDVRIKKACMLLQRDDLQVSDVAYMVGFTDPKYFSLTFKKEKGMSPTNYIKSLK